MNDALQGAIKIGEISAARVIKLASDNTNLKRAMWRAIYQLRSGKAAEAKRTLEEAIGHDNR
jgi:N-acetylmuramic acid 6-phosphate (MurNAc-6-P) etherase